MIGEFKGKKPTVAASAFVHRRAELYGDVQVGDKAAIFQFCVMRGDINGIKVGACTNVQELSVLHVTDECPCILEDWVTVGHMALIHGAVVKKGALIGMGAVLLDGVVIEEEAWVAAGAVVPPNMKVPPRVIVAGTPAKILRKLREEEVAETYRRAKRYIEELGPWYKGLQEKS